MATSSIGSSPLPDPTRIDPPTVNSRSEPAAPATAAASPLVPVLALIFNALTWGLSWWPFRWLQSHGLHPLWATAAIYSLVVLALVLARPHAAPTLWRTPSLWGLVLAAGCTNAAFNWGVTVGDVVRVVLLFYLMPIWAVLLARSLLGEAITAWSLAAVALALLGAAIVLWPTDGASQWPLPRSGAEWLGVLGGFSFALNNVLLRREAQRSEEARALAMFLGGAAVSAVLALGLAWHGTVPLPGAPSASWALPVLGLALAFLGGNLALQLGAARLPAQVTAVVMMTEVLFAAVSAVAWGAASVTPGLLLGGALIMAAGLLSAWRA